MSHIIKFNEPVEMAREENMPQRYRRPRIYVVPHPEEIYTDNDNPRGFHIDLFDYVGDKELRASCDLWPEGSERNKANLWQHVFQKLLDRMLKAKIKEVSNDETSI